MGVLTVVAIAFLRCRRGVVVPLGLSGHTCGSEHSMSADCVGRVRAVRDGTSAGCTISIDFVTDFLSLVGAAG